MEKQILHSFKRNETEEVQISIGSYKEKNYIDLRIFFKSGDEWRPTKKGLTLTTELVPELLIGLERFNEVAAHNESV